MNTMNRLLGSDEGCAKYIEDYIHSWRTHDDFIKVVGKANAQKLMNNVTSHLLAPYRSWIKSDGEITELMEQSLFEKKGSKT
jgi:hypothetical protein